MPPMEENVSSHVASSTGATTKKSDLETRIRGNGNESDAVVPGNSVSSLQSQQDDLTAHLEHLAVETTKPPFSQSNTNNSRASTPVHSSTSSQSRSSKASPNNNTMASMPSPNHSRTNSSTSSTMNLPFFGNGMVRNQSSPSFLDASPKSSPQQQQQQQQQYPPRPPRSPLSNNAGFVQPRNTINSTTATTTAAGRQHHSELTPVTRNSHNDLEYLYVDHNRSVPITPEDAMNHAATTTVNGPARHLHGAHLAFPSTRRSSSSLSSKGSSNNNDNGNGNDNDKTTNVGQPPLQQRTNSRPDTFSPTAPNATTIDHTRPFFPPVAMTNRAMSVGHLDSRSLAETSHLAKLKENDPTWDYHEEENEDLDGCDNNNNTNTSNNHRALPFPARRFYSFNSGSQYKAAVEQQFVAPTSPYTAGLKPYQPETRELGQETLGVSKNMPREELSMLFRSPGSSITNRREHVPLPSSSATNNNINGAFVRGIPLEERQYSIPSIRIAHHVNGSTMSYTDEEDDLFFPNNNTYDDDASLSSRGSSLYLPEGSESFVPIPTTAQDHQQPGTVETQMTFPPYYQKPSASLSSAGALHIIEDGIQNISHHNTDVGLDNVSQVAVNSTNASAASTSDRYHPYAIANANTNTNNDPHAQGQATTTTRRKKKRIQPNNYEQSMQAYEWIKELQLEPENNVFVEAASSKFLTGRQQQQQGHALAP